jgi:hypothetical protein
MRRILLLLILLSAVPSGISKGQNLTGNASDVLENLYGRLVNNYDDSTRIRINDSIRVIIDSYVKSDSIFSHRFNNLRYLGQITSPDSLLKIVTWNLVLSRGQGRYFCYIIRRKDAGKSNSNSIYSLSASYRPDPILTDTTYTASDWYGALYYDLRPVDYNGNLYWILLGINYGDPEISRKLIDVLSFTSDSTLVLGKKWFANEGKNEYRVILEYASNAMISLRFSSDKSVVFDHLVSFSPAFADDHRYFGPDYSYDAYTFEDGIWRLKINVDARNKE